MAERAVSHYRVIETIGGGGMGVVFRAEDSRLGRPVALKFLPDEISRDAAAVERFLRAARAASALNHPHICTIYDIGAADGQHFIAMELLEGETLRQRIGGKPIATDGLVDLALGIADGVDDAYTSRIDHRDIKPANIVVTTRGQAKILDLGLAKMHGEAAGFSRMVTSPPGDEHLTSPGTTL